MPNREYHLLGQGQLAHLLRAAKRNAYIATFYYTPITTWGREKISGGKMKDRLYAVLKY